MNSALATATDSSLGARLIEVFGNAHMVLLHFPVGLLITAAMLEFGSLLFRRGGRGEQSLDDGGDSPSRGSRPFGPATACLIVGGLFAGLAVWSGWTLAGDRTDVERHRWLGVAAASTAGVSMIVLLVWHMSSHAVWGRLYRFFLLGGAVTTALAGHFGGGLVHGSNFVFRPLFESTASTNVEPDTGDDSADADEQATDSDTDGATDTDDVNSDPPVVTFVADVWPIMEMYCFSCHGPNRQRADLRLDTYEGIMKQLDDYAIVSAEHPELSDLFRRITEPMESFDRMPPNDDVLTEAEIETIRAWIEQGAIEDSGAGG